LGWETSRNQSASAIQRYYDGSSRVHRILPSYIAVHVFSFRPGRLLGIRSPPPAKKQKLTIPGITAIDKMDRLAGVPDKKSNHQKRCSCRTPSMGRLGINCDVRIG